MAIEHAGIHAVRKPWGSADLRPWSTMHDGTKIGELWFQRNDNASRSALLLKLLFTREPLSIQVHPNDDFAPSGHGKSEAWYVLSAEPGAKVAIGLQQQLTALQFRSSLENGRISDLVAWRPVEKGDFIFVPAGTIHAIGAGLVIAEIQQRSDATFRLFDYGRQRELHVDQAVAVARAGPEASQPPQRRLSEARTLLVSSSHFVVERLELPPNSTWHLRADSETWFLVLEGHARIEELNPFAGEAIFLDATQAKVEAGDGGLVGLVAYVGPVRTSNLLTNLDPPVDHVRSDDGSLPRRAPYGKATVLESLDLEALT